MSTESHNHEIRHAWEYHNATKHSEWSIRSSRHYLDWANQPLALKIYTTLEPIPLPRDADQTGVSALSAISATETYVEGESTPTLEDLARIFYFSAGITRKKTYPGGEIYFRAASCTGALYEVELYFVCDDLPGLNAGVYHFGPGDFALRQLRAGDYRGVFGLSAPVVVVCTGTYWRNSWKYGARTYRHFGWDNGTILANMLAMTAALNLPSQVHCAFIDSDVNALLDLDTRREVAFSVVTIGQTLTKPPAPPTEMPKLDFPTVPLSQSEVDYPEMWHIHQASSLSSPDAAFGLPHQSRPQTEAVTAAMNRGTTNMSADTIEQVILRRGSSRRFDRKSITRDQLTSILHCSTRGIPADFSPMNHLYLIINAVDDVPAGAYVYHRENDRLECLKQGQFRNEARHLGLQQDLPGDASADVFFLADLNSVLERFGNRGYRAVQLESGILGGKIYLAAYAQRLGATGLTFFDDDVTNFLSPHAKDKSAIFLMALGKGRKFE
jgi:SagB-type dehydrogenase family enzyme